METDVLELTGDWQQGSDGQRNYRFKIEQGGALVALSVAKPGESSGAQSLVQGDWVNADPGIVIWFKEAAPGAVVSWSAWDAAK